MTHYVDDIDIDVVDDDDDDEMMMIDSHSLEHKQYIL